MTRITVIGGTGYTGSAIVAAAAARGHEVTSYSRNLPADPVEGVEYVAADLLDPSVTDRALEGADVVVSALSPRGALEGALEGIDVELARKAAAAGVRLVVVGGFGSLRPVAGAPRIAESPDFPEAYRAESEEMARVLSALEAGIESLSWLYVSPTAGYGAHNPGETTGSYRVGGAVVAPDAGEVSGVDFGIAVVDLAGQAETTGHVSVFA